MNAYPYAATLTPDIVKAYVAHIASIADEGDDERAHGAEYNLRKEVLTAIATSRLTGADASLAALYALSTDQIDFERWFA